MPHYQVDIISKSTIIDDQRDKTAKMLYQITVTAFKVDKQCLSDWAMLVFPHRDECASETEYQAKLAKVTYKRYEWLDAVAEQLGWFTNSGIINQNWEEFFTGILIEEV